MNANWRKINYLLIIIAITLIFLNLLFAISTNNNVTNGSDFNFPNTEIEKFSIIVLPDTQKYVLNQANPEIFISQTEWIVEEKDSRNIIFVSHEGDIVDTWDNETEWEDANKAIYVLENSGVAFGLNLGNHDHEAFDGAKSATYYEIYFPESRFSGKEWYKGSFRNNTSSYQKVNVLGKELLFLNLDYCPDTEEIAWGNSILSSESYDLAFLTTHGYLGLNAQRNIHICGSTQYVWDDLIKQHENLRFVFSGHVHGESRRVDPNNYEKDVYQMLADYQSGLNGGNGYLRILTFVPKEDKVLVQTYSPHIDDYLLQNPSNFQIDFEWE